MKHSKGFGNGRVQGGENRRQGWTRFFDVLCEPILGRVDGLFPPANYNVAPGAGLSWIVRVG